MKAVTGLTVLAALLAAVIALEVEAGAPDADDASAAKVHYEIEKPARADAPLVDFDRLTATILARPLFAANRRPPTSAAKTVAAAPVSQEVLPRLSGIVIDGQTRLAVFQPTESEKPVVVGEGGEIAGRKVMKISALEVVIAGHAGDEHLHPMPDATLAPSDVPVPPPIAAPTPRASRRGMQNADEARAGLKPSPQLINPRRGGLGRRGRGGEASGAEK